MMKGVPKYETLEAEKYTSLYNDFANSVPLDYVGQ